MTRQTIRQVPQISLVLAREQNLVPIAYRDLRLLDDAAVERLAG
jgi:hypothetical protein